MATIYQAWDIALERVVAVKILHAHLADDQEIQERFRHEARHAAALVHPHIVAVFDQGVDDLPYIVMELIDGPSLREVLRERERLSPPEALAVILPVCAALARAHAAGVIHRDIKPENVLITLDGTPKVADFGIAYAVTATRHTSTGTLIGSVHYLAPELIQGREASPATDQYAVGVLAFELLTGRKPLPAATPMAVIARHAREPIPPPSQFAPDITSAVDRAVMRAAALDPTQRFPDLHRFTVAMRAAIPGGSKAIDVRGDRTLVIPPASFQPLSRAGVNARHAPAKRATPVLPALLLALVLFIGTTGGLYALWDRVIAPERAVPSVEGLPQEQARTVLGALGLALVEGQTMPSRDDPEGTVLAQDPQPGTRLRRGEAVTVVLSSGPRVVPMPRVLQLSEEDARALLAPHGFAISRDESFSDHAPRGEVIAQLPDAGAPVREGAEVRIHLSKGKEQVRVPDLVGATREEAGAALAKAKLTAAFVEEYSDDASEAGLVLRQSIEPGATVDKGTTVQVVVSKGKGPATFEMPDVRRRVLDEVWRALQVQGLAVSVIAQPRPRFGYFVRSQSG